MTLQSTPPAQLRIALFTGNYNYIKDGVALTLNRLVRFLDRKGVAVLVFAPTGPRPAFEAYGDLVAVPSVPIPFRSEYRISLGLPKAARQRLVDFKPNLFHIAVPDVLGYRALTLAEEWKVPVVASFHTRYDTYLKFYGLGFLEKLGSRYLRNFYNRCRQIYPPSESMAAIIAAEGYSQNIRVWSRGVDQDVFNPGQRDMAWRRALGVADGDVLINFTGRLVKEKNTGLVTSVLQALKARGLPFRALIVGDGPEMARMQQLLGDVIFPGFLTGPELSRAYASSDVFFFPSESETFGNVTLEAMASGLPAVCADASGSRSLVLDGKTGYLVNPRNEADFVERLATLITDEGLRNTMKNAALAHAATFSWDHILQGLLDNYREVVASEI